MPSAYLKLEAMESLRCTSCHRYIMGEGVGIVMERKLAGKDDFTVTEVICIKCQGRTGLVSIPTDRARERVGELRRMLKKEGS